MFLVLGCSVSVGAILSSQFGATLQRSSPHDQHCGMWRRASGRGKQSPADFVRPGARLTRTESLATVGKGSRSDRDKRSLELSALLPARASETACAGSGSLLLVRLRTPGFVPLSGTVPVGEGRRSLTEWFAVGVASLT